MSLTRNINFIALYGIGESSIFTAKLMSLTHNWVFIIVSAADKQQCVNRQFNVTSIILAI